MRKENRGDWLQVDLIGSDGKVYRFLAKPKDDLRKDNRMMEVASILNGLFAKDPASRRRNLLIRRLAQPPGCPYCVDGDAPSYKEHAMLSSMG